MSQVYLNMEGIHASGKEIMEGQMTMDSTIEYVRMVDETVLHETSDAWWGA